MNSNIFTLNWKNVLGAFASAVIVAGLSYIVYIADIWKINFHDVVNLMVLAGAGSLLKAFLTDSNGNFAGVFPIK